MHPLSLAFAIYNAFPSTHFNPAHSNQLLQACLIFRFATVAAFQERFKAQSHQSVSHLKTFHRLQLQVENAMVGLSHAHIWPSTIGYFLSNHSYLLSSNPVKANTHEQNIFGGHQELDQGEPSQEIIHLPSINHINFFVSYTKSVPYSRSQMPSL